MGPRGVGNADRPFHSPPPLPLLIGLVAGPVAVALL